LCAQVIDLRETCDLAYDEAEYARLIAERDVPDNAGGAGGLGGAGGAEIEDPLIDVTCTSDWLYCEGRRHVTWGERGIAAAGDRVGQWLARAAANEAGSVRSFRCLRDELSQAGLRGPWARRLRQAARQEIRHTRLMDRLALSHGASRASQKFLPVPRRELFELALENAREGCVGEAYAGLVAWHQASRAKDAAVRAAFVRIARDEASHADLAWDLHRELSARLSPGERISLSQELEAEVERLERADRDATADLSPADVATLGLPTVPIQHALRQGLARELRQRIGAG